MWFISCLFCVCMDINKNYEVWNQDFLFEAMSFIFHVTFSAFSTCRKRFSEERRERVCFLFERVVLCSLRVKKYAICDDLKIRNCHDWLCIGRECHVNRRSTANWFRVATNEVEHNLRPNYPFNALICQESCTQRIAAESIIHIYTQHDIRIRDQNWFCDKFDGKLHQKLPGWLIKCRNVWVKCTANPNVLHWFAERSTEMQRMRKQEWVVKFFTRWQTFYLESTVFHIVMTDMIYIWTWANRHSSKAYSECVCWIAFSRF